MKQIYTAITAHLSSTMPQLKQIGLYNNQFAYMGLTNEGKNVKQTLFFPCALIEFPGDIEFQALGVNTQIAPELTVRVHLGFETSKENPIEIFDVKDLLVQNLHGFQSENFTKLIRTSEATDTDFKNVYVYKVDFQTSYRDNQTYLYTNNPSVNLTAVTISSSI